MTTPTGLTVGLVNELLDLQDSRLKEVDALIAAASAIAYDDECCALFEAARGKIAEMGRLGSAIHNICGEQPGS